MTFGLGEARIDGEDPAQPKEMVRLGLWQCAGLWALAWHAEAASIGQWEAQPGGGGAGSFGPGPRQWAGPRRERLAEGGSACWVGGLAGKWFGPCAWSFGLGSLH